MEQPHFVYIMASRSRCMYTGMGEDLVRRVGQHKGLLPPENSFTSLYHCHRLVYFEVAPTRRAALERERQIKSWSRAKKLDLITRLNPGWRDLAARWPEIESLEPEADPIAPRDGDDRSE